MKYPKGTKFQAWCLYSEKQRGVYRPAIKRWVTLPEKPPKSERLPVREYAHFREDPKQLAAYLTRLNAEHAKEVAAIKAIKVTLAYLNEDMVLRYEKRRRREVPSQDRVTTEIFYLRNHFLNYFSGVLNLRTPVEWHKVHKDEWADYLLSDSVPKAPATKREIIQAANRFMAWLHEERPTEVPMLVFKPIAKERFRDLVSRREIDDTVKKRTFIKPDDWKAICKNLTPELEPFVMLAYNYGARRSECLGFRGGDVKKGHLLVERSLETIVPDTTFKPTKGKLRRTVPHWFTTPKEAFAWIEAALLYRVDPDTLTQLWKDCMSSLNLTYDFHDVRHSFVTRSLRAGKNPRDVQLAAGHKHIKTTMGYAHDDRDSDGDEWNPAA